MKRFLILALTLGLLASACAPRVIPAPTMTPAPVVPPEATPTLPSPGAPAATNPAAEVARKQLAANLPAELDQIQVVTAEQVDWPDSCLGIQQGGVMCAQMVTSGYRIILEVNGRQYEYHTNLDGSQIVPASSMLTWTRQGGIAGFCDYLYVYSSGEVYTSSCKTEGSMNTLKDVLTQDEQTQLNDWLTRFGQVTVDASDPKNVADGMQRVLMFQGYGDQQPDEAEQQAMLSFAQNLYGKVNS